MRREHKEPREQSPAAQDGPADDAVQGVREDERHLRQLQRERQARVAKVIVVLAIVVVLTIFVVANSQPVKVNFVFVTRHPRLIWVMFACAVLGGVAGYLIGKPGKQVRLHRRNKPGDDRDRRSH